MENTNQILVILLGAALLLAGRRLFWLFVGIVGFVLGVQFLGPFLTGVGDGSIPVLLGGLLGGILGALLAIFAQGAAIILAGFVAGGKILIYLAQLITALSTNAQFVFFVIGGVFGAAFLMLFFDVALIILTSLWGASLIVAQFTLTPFINGLVYVLLVVVGITAQFISARR